MAKTYQSYTEAKLQSNNYTNKKTKKTVQQQQNTGQVNQTMPILSLSGQETAMIQSSVNELCSPSTFQLS